MSESESISRREGRLGKGELRLEGSLRGGVAGEISSLRKSGRGIYRGKSLEWKLKTKWGRKKEHPS